jgi:hypothetical protein
VCSGELRHEKEFGLVSHAGNVTQAWLTGLLPATAYDITVRAKTRHKEAGHSSDTLTVATPSGRPHRPIINKSYQESIL